jgi:hypothetical protein
VALTLVTDPVGSLLAGLPAWYQVPALITLVLPLLGFAALLVFSAGRASEALVGGGHRRLGTVVTGVLAAVAAAAAILFEVNLVVYFPDVLITVGVVVAAWAGAFTVDAIVLKRSDAVPVRFAVLVGMGAAIGLGFGLVSSSVSWLSWQGYLVPVLDQLRLIDLSQAAAGVFVSFVLSALVALIAGLGLRSKEASESHD